MIDLKLVTVALGCWSAVSPFLFYWLGHRNKVRETIPNIRPSYAFSTKGFVCSIEIQARTSEDIRVVQIAAEGPIHIGEPTPNYSDEGHIYAHTYDFLPSPVPLDWLIPGNEVRTFQVVVDCPDRFAIELLLSSSMRTLWRRSASIYPPIAP